MSRLPLRRLGTGTGLVIAWCALWGQFSVANIVSGFVVAAVVLNVGVGNAVRGGIRPKPLARFIAVVAVDLVQATIAVARAVLSRHELADEAIVAVELPPSTRRHFMLLICAITVTPGTAVVDADPDTGCMYLHVLDAGNVDSVRRHTELLAELADQALPVREVGAAGRTEEVPT